MRRRIHVGLVVLGLAVGLTRVGRTQKVRVISEDGNPIAEVGVKFQAGQEALAPIANLTDGGAPIPAFTEENGEAALSVLAVDLREEAAPAVVRGKVVIRSGWAERLVMFAFFVD